MYEPDPDVMARIGVDDINVLTGFTVLANPFVRIANAQLG